ncbi:hypothetical protein E6C60_2159 [Paenibacillus algicola]|uniref:Uncharacterized protein n=1 Tax=Paenibacillus algicola TaxID=2565926 RepID=A0A4V1G3Z1_9BACL|nr:hypothetical protein E6C60_2159 [Paenibacillus algicola]
MLFHGLDGNESARIQSNIIHHFETASMFRRKFVIRCKD